MLRRVITNIKNPMDGALGLNQEGPLIIAKVLSSKEY